MAAGRFPNGAQKIQKKSSEESENWFRGSKNASQMIQKNVKGGCCICPGLGFVCVAVCLARSFVVGDYPGLKTRAPRGNPGARDREKKSLVSLRRPCGAELYYPRPTPFWVGFGAKPQTFDFCFVFGVISGYKGIKTMQLALPRRSRVVSSSEDIIRKSYDIFEPSTHVIKFQ